MAFWTLSTAFAFLLSNAQTERSSTKRACSVGRFFVTYSMKRRTKRGASTDPWGTPCFIFRLLPIAEPYNTLDWRLFRKAAIHLMNFAGILFSDSVILAMSHSPYCIKGF